MRDGKERALVFCSSRWRVCRVGGPPVSRHPRVSAPRERRRGKEDGLELKTNLENPHVIDPVVRQPIDNNREALDELFARYRGRLYQTARKVLGNSDDAEDALQDGLLSAFRNLSQFKGRSQFSTWLTRVVVNAALMRLRQIRPKVMTSSIDQKL